MLRNSVVVLIAVLFVQCASISSEKSSNNEVLDSLDQIEWASCLTPDQYKVLRQGGTERPFTGELLTNVEKGIYLCAGCKNPLFHSDTKFDSGTGWPSFYQKINDVNVGERPEIFPSGVQGIEVYCTKCDGHLGHVFEDGPQPTGLRYCINSISLVFEKDEATLDEVE